MTTTHPQLLAMKLFSGLDSDSAVFVFEFSGGAIVRPKRKERELCVPSKRGGFSLHGNNGQ